MKKVLCYLGIVVLFGLGVLPPVLRIFYKDEDKKEVETIESIILVCTSDTYMTTTSYENDEVKKIAIKKIIANNLEDSEVDDSTETDDSSDVVEDEDMNNEDLNDSELESSDEELKTGMDILFDSLYESENENLIRNTLEDGEVVWIDFNTSKYEDIELSNITKLPEDQKEYYESLELTCIIRK